jgi:acetyl-CoA C-acetyltransferase
MVVKMINIFLYTSLLWHVSLTKTYPACTFLLQDSPAVHHTLKGDTHERCCDRCACRTAIGSYGGSLKPMNGATLAGIVMKEAVQRADIDPSIIDDVRFGCCLEHHDTLNVTRIAALLGGIPESVPAGTINRVCISGMEAVISGAAMIQAEMADVILAGGVEHMSGVPYAVPCARWGARIQDHVFVDAMMHALHCGSHLIPLDDSAPLDTSVAPASLSLGQPYIMGHTAEFIAQKLGITREEMDAVALRSQNNAERATGDGSFTEEIVDVPVPRRKQEPLIFNKDEHFRPGLTMEQLAKLQPAFVSENGKVTAGNASGINEAFAAQYIGCERELGLNREITNVNGSGIGLGHPIGATGCRIMVTLIHAMKKRGNQLGLATLCGGGGVSMACAIEMV